jgi:hypothetical protein
MRSRSPFGPASRPAPKSPFANVVLPPFGQTRQGCCRPSSLRNRFSEYHAWNHFTTNCAVMGPSNNPGWGHLETVRPPPPARSRARLCGIERSATRDRPRSRSDRLKRSRASSRWGGREGDWRQEGDLPETLDEDDCRVPLLRSPSCRDLGEETVEPQPRRTT